MVKQYTVEELKVKVKDPSFDLQDVHGQSLEAFVKDAQFKFLKKNVTKQDRINRIILQFRCSFPVFSIFHDIS